MIEKPIRQKELFAALIGPSSHSTQLLHQNSTNSRRVMSPLLSRRKASFRKEATVDEVHHNKILLAEDNAINVLAAQEFLSWAGHRCDVARDGAEAVDMFMTKTYELVLMDCLMPSMSGFEATTKIREYERARGSKRCRIVGMTGLTSSEDITRCINSGMDEYVGKPFSKEELKVIVDRAIGIDL